MLAPTFRVDIILLTDSNATVPQAFSCRITVVIGTSELSPWFPRPPSHCVFSLVAQTTQNGCTVYWVVQPVKIFRWVLGRPTNH